MPCAIWGFLSQRLFSVASLVASAIKTYGNAIWSPPPRSRFGKLIFSIKENSITQSFVPNRFIPELRFGSLASVVKGSACGCWLLAVSLKSLSGWKLCSPINAVKVSVNAVLYSWAQRQKFFDIRRQKKKRDLKVTKDIFYSSKHQYVGVSEFLPPQGTAVDVHTTLQLKQQSN
jgi:hypothetical protein